ncbi:MAG: hypothetical protein SFV51_19460 [Bryobacteraceae bacterium]|nr:hypothetical protein [Bryobacteraceae bacterium]
MRRSSFVCLLLAAATICPAADFFTGQAARVVIGQRTFTEQKSGAAADLLGAVGGLAYANGTLVVVDDNRVSALPQNNRVLVFRDVASFIPEPNREIPISEERCPVCVGKATTVIGQPDFEKTDLALNERGFNRPTGIATDGQRLAICDTDNNRVLIWNSLPSANNQQADLVLGQPDFRSRAANEGSITPSQRSLSGPQGVWIQNNRLYVADTLNNRVLVWNTFPSQNFQPADMVLGAPNFTTTPPQDLRQQSFDPKPENMLQPVSVTSDGTKLFVADLGYNRVLIWNSIPTQNAAPADVAVGQPDLRSGLANNTQNLCPEERTKNADGEDVFPPMCRASMDFPRFALSDGKRLFVADGGNDRVLVYNQIPTQSGQNADVILGQIASRLNQVSDSANPLGRSSSDSVATPMGLAFDGTNLYVSDPFRRRVLVFTPGETLVPYSGVRNLFSRAVFAVGVITFSGSVKENDEVTLKIGKDIEDEGIKAREYKYKAKANDTFSNIVNGLVEAVNTSNNGDGDRDVLASPNLPFDTIVLTARLQGEAGNAVEFSSTVSTGAEIAISTSGATLSGGQDAAKIAPGALVTILGERLSDQTVSAPEGINPLPTELGGVQVYFDGIRSPILSVSPDEVRAQVPFEVNDANSISAYLRIRRAGGVVETTAAVAVPVIPQNPGILAEENVPDPRPGFVYHFSSNSTATVSVDGSVKANDVATVIIEGREYTYTVKEGDTLESIRDALINLINENPEEKVTASAAGVFTRIRLRAKVAGPEGNGIRIETRVSTDAQVILTATNSATCCANQAGARVTEDNPAVPGETIVVFGTGLGLVNPRDAQFSTATGFRYFGPEINRPDEFVSSLAGGKTANVLYAGLAQGLVGIYEVHLELNSDLPTNPRTQVTIAQDIYVSNIVAFPVRNIAGTATTP